MKTSKTEIYEASDYAGLRAGGYEFYYGYEKVYCPKHEVYGVQDSPNCKYDNNAENDCDQNTEWAFVAQKDGRIIKSYAQSDLVSLAKDSDSTAYYLLAGIAKMLEEKELAL